MKVTVNEKTQRFYLAFDKWEPAVGHEINVGKYRFSAIPMKNVLNISEVTSGTKIMNIPITFPMMLATATKEETLEFFAQVGVRLIDLIRRNENFDIQLAKIKKEAIERLGEMPPIEYIDTDWLSADISDVLN